MKISFCKMMFPVTCDYQFIIFNACLNDYTNWNYIIKYYGSKQQYFWNFLFHKGSCVIKTHLLHYSRRSDYVSTKWSLFHIWHISRQCNLLNKQLIIYFVPCYFLRKMCFKNMGVRPVIFEWLLEEFYY